MHSDFLRLEPFVPQDVFGPNTDTGWIKTAANYVSYTY